MPKEIRTIIFYGREVLQAMAAFASRNKAPMPQGTLDGLNFNPSGEPALTLIIKPMGTPVAQRLAFRKAEVAAALILYCRDKHIPLPKDCCKDLVSRDGYPAIHLEMD